MIQYHVYPGGKKRIVTFSYDDGPNEDARLIELFRTYGVKGTFHLNSTRFSHPTEEDAEELRARYAGQEVAAHTVSHGWPARMPKQSLVFEVLSDRRELERIFGVPVVGMSYPSGSYNDAVCAVMDACGIVYARTTRATRDFCLPEDFLQWHPTCHHRDALPLCEKFMEQLDSEWYSPLLYIWGHAHEFRTEEDWAHMERILQTVSGSDRIWYATNLEIYDYITAQKQLRISADERVFQNPTALDLWVERDKKEQICIPAGTTVRT